MARKSALGSVAVGWLGVDMGAVVSISPEAGKSGFWLRYQVRKRFGRVTRRRTVWLKSVRVRVVVCFACIGGPLGTLGESELELRRY